MNSDNIEVNFADPSAPSSSNGVRPERPPKKTKKKKKNAKKPGKAAASRSASVFLPGQPLEEDEELVCDKSVYDLYQTMQTGAPCLSFDVIRDSFGDGRNTYPMTAYVVAGTQAEQKFNNNLLILKLMNMHRTKESLKREAKENAGEENEEDESSDSSGDEDEEEAELSSISIKHTSCVNRVRTTCVGEHRLVASWSECGKVFLWDISEPLQKLATKDELNERAEGHEPVFSFNGHLTEGYGMDWSPTVPGSLLTGDCKSRIHLWKQSGSTWIVDQRPFQAHEGSVEDIQWSPTEATVFASCSVDKSVRVWDVRAPPHKACMITVADAHTSDVNVISWNKTDPFIVSGGDDGVLNVWDLRELQTPKPQAVAVFKHHTKPVTTVEWNPNDSSVFASGGADDQIAFWDIAVEADDEDGDGDGDAVMGEGGEKVPPQLLFIHQGQKDIKELHWHPQIPGVVISTALTGFNIFKSISF